MTQDELWLTRRQAVVELKNLEDKYLEGLDAESWYGYRQVLEKSLNEDN